MQFRATLKTTTEMMYMQEKKLNMFAKQEEYMALRQYIRLVSE